MLVKFDGAGLFIDNPDFALGDFVEHAQGIAHHAMVHAAAHTAAIAHAGHVLTMLGFAGVVLVLVVGAAYLAWRDTFGDSAASSPVPPPVHGFEA